LPDAKEYVKLLKEREKFEQMRLLDELVNVGVSNEVSLRSIVAARGIVGRYKDFVATSPLIHGDLQRSLQAEKANLVQSFKTELDEILIKIRNERFPEVELTESSSDEGVGWILEAEGVSPLHILLVPWILRRHTQLMREAESYAMITTNQSLPSISQILSALEGRNLTVLCKFEKKFFIRVFGGSHKMLDEILENLRREGYETQEEEALPPKKEQERGRKTAVGKPYEELMQLEMGLRRFVQSKLEATTLNWWKECIPDDVKRTAEERKANNETLWPWYTQKNLHSIHYVDFPDYVKIITRRDNWNQVFELVFKDKEIVSAKLRELEPIRNSIAHSRELSAEEGDKLRIYAREIIEAMRNRGLR